MIVVRAKDYAAPGGEEEDLPELPQAVGALRKRSPQERGAVFRPGRYLTRTVPRLAGSEDVVASLRPQPE